MVQKETWFESDDEAKLYLRRWLPEQSKPLAVVHILHGMAEHSGRYRHLAEKLCNANIAVWALDQRGHGKTADLQINSRDKGGVLGHCADKNTFQRVTDDVYCLNRKIREKYPDIPLILLGHSWGSFIAQNYIENKDSGEGTVDCCILSGTRGPGGLKMKCGSLLMGLLALFSKKSKGLPFARKIADGSYNKPFSPNRTSFDWLSNDEAEVDAYQNDPYSGNLCSIGFYRDLMKGFNKIHKIKAISQIRKDLPIYIFCGSSDPVGDMGASPTKLVNIYRSFGIKDLEFVLYPGARHETLNETNREEVMDALLSWIRRHINGE